MRDLCVTETEISKVGQTFEMLQARVANLRGSEIEYPEALQLSQMRKSGIANLITEGEQGYLFNPNDVREIRAAFDKMHGNPENRIKLGHVARALAHDFSIEPIAERYVALYKEGKQAEEDLI